MTTHDGETRQVARSSPGSPLAGRFPAAICSWGRSCWKSTLRLSGPLPDALGGDSYHAVTYYTLQLDAMTRLRAQRSVVGSSRAVCALLRRVSEAPDVERCRLVRAWH